MHATVARASGIASLDRRPRRADDSQPTPPPVDPSAPDVASPEMASPEVASPEVASPAPDVSPQPAAPHADLELPPGTMVGEYQITGLLGTGGMGSVYAGVQPVIGKKVAIKVLLRELAANPQVVARFMQEARAVNQAQSRHIIDIFSWGQLPDQRHYFVMEHLEGASLRHFLRERKALGFDEAYAILTCICKGLSAAHSKGIIHRDIKPENIMVKTEEDGALSAKILDFGIAKLQGGDGSQPGFATRTGAAMGTPYYMSPEQCRGVGVDHRTDIYALGIIMFEMFTGALPFSARSYIDLVNKHLYASPPSPSQIRNNISPILEALILRCIAKDPNERPESVEQVLHELQQVAPSLRGTSFNLDTPGFVPGEEVIIPPVTGAPRSSPKPSPQPRGAGVRVALVLGLVLALAGGGGVAAYFVVKSRAGHGSGSGSGAVLPGSGSGAMTGPGTSTAASQTPGTLSITTRPAGARVYVDKEARPGMTPIELKVPPGKHELRLERDGFKVITDWVEIKPGGQHSATYALVVTAEPATSQGSVKLRTGVEGAVYLLDGAQVGSGPQIALSNIKAGSHQLRITASGHLPLERTLDVEAGGTVDLELTLTRARHTKTPHKKPGKGEKRDTSEDPDGTINPFGRKH